MTEPDVSVDRLRGARALAHVLDDGVRIPVIGVRFGLDPVIGLIPGLGDFAGAIMSGYVVLVGARLGAPRSVILRMLGNVAVDTVAGSVPLLGDLFDVGWKSNLRNVALLDRWIDQPARTRAGSRRAVGFTVLALVLLAVAGVALTVFVLRALLIALRS
ncbi:MAG: DUF4112 domain-containing protein [Gemmatimonadota bacterium]|nr:DUF4112 domain-containing protein [Gemmatimonadota bacterium]